ncbi:MAG TPA: adenylate/guanylate cyclase domain-containing protein [Acidimicrobiia bacterium]|nr:adenylate/guanylate cyclase domain-containing protein [Acidimicrobiia bacterium]
MDLRLRGFLQRRGASAEEIARAEREHWLALLTADRLLVPGRPRYDQAEVAAKTGVDRALADRIWRALGFPDPPAGAAVFTDRDAEMLDTFLHTARMTIGDEADEFVEQARAVASGLARLAEFFSDQIAGAIEAGWSSGVDDEALAVAVMDGTNWSTLARLLDYTLRLQTRAALWRKLANQDVGDQSGWPLTIGFVDLVGYTALSQELEPDELARLVARFEALAYDAVAARGGRVVKMIGDEVMFAADECEVGASIALALTGAVESDDVLPVARAGLAAGPVVAREGDYFGPTVNLASRLVEIAKPGAVLVSADVYDALAGEDAFTWRRLRPRRVRDIGRVDVWVLRPSREAVEAGRPRHGSG